MEIYKFGGASVNDAQGIKNMARIASNCSSKVVVVVSALGKTTNALEKVVDHLCKKAKNLDDEVLQIEKYHKQISRELFRSDTVDFDLSKEFQKFRSFISKVDKKNFDKLYDQVVSFGELWSTLIVNHWFTKNNIDSNWVDIRKHLITDRRYRDANINWSESKIRINNLIKKHTSQIIVTQGFIGGTLEGDTTTLGREGSDFTAGVLGSILNVTKVTIWKNVPGVLNADPNWLSDTQKLNKMSYKEAIEMSFSGAKVLHPKTIKPLHNKGIPLIVRSFLNDTDSGTTISTDESIVQNVPLYIKKDNQILLSIIPKDFSFVIGDNLGILFKKFYEIGIKSNLVQTSAISMAVCIDADIERLNKLIEEISDDYKVLINNDVELITLRYYDAEAILRVTKKREIILEQRTRRSIRYVMRTNVGNFK